MPFLITSIIIIITFTVGMMLTYRFGYRDGVISILRRMDSGVSKKKEGDHFERVIDGGSIQ
jgi:hypothetical protein